MYENVFQKECLRLIGGSYIELDNNYKNVIKTHYGLSKSLRIFTVDGKIVNFDLRVKELYLYNSVCQTYKNGLTDKNLKTEEDVSLIALEIIARVIRFPKFYYTLIDYNLPDTSYIKDHILSELLIMFDLNLEELKLDNFIYYEESRWKLRGFESLFNLFKLVKYLDLIVYDMKEQIDGCLKRV